MHLVRKVVVRHLLPCHFPGNVIPIHFDDTIEATVIRQVFCTRVAVELPVSPLTQPLMPQSASQYEAATQDSWQPGPVIERHCLDVVKQTHSAVSPGD